MPVYVSILRGINVSGQKMIKMPALKAMYESLGFENVITYIQSGNVVFECKAAEKPGHQIEQQIKETFSFDVPVLILTKEEMQKVVSGNPFLKRKGVEQDKLHVTFLEQTPAREHLEKIAHLNYHPDEFIISGKVIYLHCPNGYGRTKLNNNFFENKLKGRATTRNWKTTNELLKMMQ